MPGTIQQARRPEIRKGQSKVTRQVIKGCGVLRERKVNVVTPLLLEVLRLLEAYLFRRAVCAIPSNSQQRPFATFSRDLQIRNLCKFNNSCSYRIRRLENHQRRE